MYLLSIYLAASELAVGLGIFTEVHGPQLRYTGPRVLGLHSWQYAALVAPWPVGS